MRVRFMGPAGLEEYAVGDVATLLERDDGFTWVDIPAFDAKSEAVLREWFRCHDAVIEARAKRNHVPLLGKAGHVHLLEIDQLIGLNYLVTVHGPINPEVDPAAALQETERELARTMAAQSHDIFARITTLEHHVPEDHRRRARPRRPVRPGPLGRRRRGAVPARCHRALPDPGQHQDDRGHGTAGGDRGGDPAGDPTRNFGRMSRIRVRKPHVVRGW